MKREGSAVWEGTLSQGNGTLSTASKTLNETQYSFRSRFEEGAGTNPEELIAAAHAGCFSMALSNELEQSRIGMHFSRPQNGPRRIVRFRDS
jgi:osmotically inducible protein OsmC